MTKINVTKNQLIAKHKELNSWRQQDSIMVHFLQSKINEFYNHNKVRIETTMREIKELNMKYFEFEEDGVTIKMVEGKQVLKPDLTMEAYQEVAKVMMNEQTVMEI